jgi:MFS family permease
MESRKVYKCLKLEHFTNEELEERFNEIASFHVHEGKEDDHNQHDHVITQDQLQIFMENVVGEIEQEQQNKLKGNGSASQEICQKDFLHWRQEYIHIQTQQLWNFLHSGDTNITTNTINKDQFTTKLHDTAQAVDFGRIWPLTLSMLMVGSTVGVTTPAMPFVVQNLGLTAGEYGMVVSAFALAKMVGNIPFAVLVERDGRKPYLVYSMIVISAGVGAIGLAGGFEQLYVCRLLTGLGVAGLSTAATMTVTDISTPLNRASTFAPIMSAFAAGTALGPALGGLLVDELGLNPLFLSVGTSYLLLAAVNSALLDETMAKPVVFPWQNGAAALLQSQQTSIKDAFQKALGQWAPLLSEAPVRNVCIMNAFYWVALAGSQMTLLPLILTNPDGLAMSATQVGQVYMGMSAVQVLGNPILAKVVDRIGKVPGIVGGCTLISISMLTLPWCDGTQQMAGVLAMWATGSTLLSTSPLAFISDHVDDEKRAQAIALLRTSGDVGFLIGASSMGALADWSGSLDMAMQSSSAVLATATCWFAIRNILTSKLAKK